MAHASLEAPGSCWAAWRMLVWQGILLCELLNELCFKQHSPGCELTKSRKFKVKADAPALLAPLWRPNKAQWCELGRALAGPPRELPAIPSSCFPKLPESPSRVQALSFPQSRSQSFIPTFLCSAVRAAHLFLAGNSFWKGSVCGRGPC